jgi:hypothetical protein
MITEKIKTAIEAYCKEYSIEIPVEERRYNELVEEILQDSTPVYSEIGSSHRWYDDEFIVVEVSGVFIGYWWYHTTGDNTPSDMDLEFDIRKVCEVEKKQKTIDYYETIK